VWVVRVLGIVSSLSSGSLPAAWSAMGARSGTVPLFRPRTPARGACERAAPSTAKRPSLGRGRGASRPLRSGGDERRIDLVLLRDGGAMSLRGRTLLTARHGGRRRNGRFGQADDDLDPALAQRPHQLRQVLQ